MITESASPVAGDQTTKRPYTRYAFDSLASGEVSAITIATENAHRASSAAWAYSKRNGVRFTVLRDKSNPSVTTIKVAPSK